MSFLGRLLGIEKNALERYESELETTNSHREAVVALSENAMKEELAGYRAELAAIAEKAELFQRLRELTPRVFAIVREATGRTTGKPHYDVQIVGGMALADGKIAEMKTGEGKTQTAVLPLVLFALAGKGVHLVTVNDYLARWQASLMGPIFRYLGLTVASIQHEKSFRYDPGYAPDEEEVQRLEAETEGLVMDVKHMRPVTRREAYAADVTYGTNNEFGFDYLRDNMARHERMLTQRDLFYAIVDEVDSILIDEARTPLIISAPDSEPTTKYYDFAAMVEQLSEHEHFEVDEKKKATTLTDAGINRVEQLLKVPNIYDTSKGVTTIHHVEQALRAKTLFKKDRDYVVRDGGVVIVDEFTGRLMFGRRYSEGLHQAIEAKENVQIQQESKTLATITFQNLFRLYARLAGMTGTAKTEEEEFYKIYQLPVEQVPTHHPMVRADAADTVYKTEKAKFEAIAKEVRRRHDTGQPVLIGTVSIAKNEQLAEQLKAEGVPFELLNAKNHEREAHIIAQAGRLGAVTLATNIAGRGVDILLGGNPVDPKEAELVKKAGGLFVLGTERHESRRIDNQLRGRSGRQGDPGASQFYVSMEDDLLRLFGGERMKGLMNTLGLPDDQPLDSSLVSRSIEQAQKKIEGLNFDSRKHVLEFDDVLDHQRKVIYRIRRRYLPGLPVSAGQKPLKDEIFELIEKEIEDLVRYELASETAGGDPADAFGRITAAVKAMIPLSAVQEKALADAYENAPDREFALIDSLTKSARELLDGKEKDAPAEAFDEMLRFVALHSLDSLWMEHLETMDHLRDSVRLRGYGQREPLVEYKREGYEQFQRLIAEINKQIAYTVFRVTVQVQEQPVVPVEGVQLSSSQGNERGSASADAAASTTGRNDPCPCGSGKKYKKCGLLNTPEHQQLMAKKA